MSQRERLLAIAVGAMVLMMGGMWIYQKVDRAFSSRSRRIEQLNGEIQRKQLIVRGGALTEKRLAKYQEMSLPSNIEVARSEYQAWLSRLIDAAEMRDPQVKHLAQSTLESRATQVTSTVSGDCTLEQLTRFLYEFYKVPTLHRITKLPIKPLLPESKLLRVNITVEALVLPTAPADAEFDPTKVGPFGERSWEEYAQAVLQRNMFGPANRPPRLEQIADQRLGLGESLELSLAARDPDKLDKLEFQLDGDLPKGLRLDRESGQLRWRPDQMGTYTFDVLVRDDGLPRLEDRATVTVTVSEAQRRQEQSPVATQEFDEAKFTYAIASLEIDGRKQVWLQIRTKGEILRLSEGDPVRIGSIDGVITHIGVRDMVMTIGEDEHLVRLGEPLVGVPIDRGQVAGDR